MHKINAFTFDGKIYKQVDGVCNGSPLGPVLANVFMAVKLEESVAPKLQTIMPIGRLYVDDDTFTFVKKKMLDVLLTKKDNGNIETSVYRKPTNNSIYIHWNAYGPRQWKTGTFSGIVRRAYDICSTEESRETELKFISDVSMATHITLSIVY